MREPRRNSYQDSEVEMRLVFACVLGWFVIAAAAALASHHADASSGPGKGRHERSGSLIVAVGAPEAR
jgi:hypothetical protein